MRKSLSLLLAVCFTATAFAGFEEAPQAGPAKFQPVQEAAEIYNEIESANEFFAYLKVDLPERDVKYIDSILPKVQHMRMPKVRVEGQQIFFDGLRKPITVIDPFKRIYSYNGQRIDLSLKEGLEAAVAKLKPVFNEETASLWDFFVPRAHAIFGDEDQALTTIGGAVGMGGLVMGGSCMMGGGGGSCVAPFAMSGIGFLGMFEGMRRKKEKEDKAEKRRALRKKRRQRKVTCEGPGVMVVKDGTGRELYRIKSGGAPPILQPVPPGTTPSGIQNGANRFVGICDNAPAVASLNYGLGAPGVLPPVYRASGPNGGPSVPSTGYKEE